MPRKSISEPVWVASRKRWKADVPASLSDTGERARAFFKTRNEARAYIETVTPNDQTEPSAIIPPKLAVEADKARSILEPTNLDLVQAARIVTVATRILEGTGGTIEEACRLYASSHADRTASLPFGDAVRSYLDSRGDLRDSTLGSYRYTLERSFAPLHERNLAEIATGDLEGILEAKGNTARAMHCRNLGAFWRWASKAPRRWANVETVEALEAPRTSNDADILILKPAEVKALLEAAEKESPSAALAYAIAVFAGVRMAELERLSWKDIGEDHIEIGKAIAKTHARRLIPICPTLRAWIEEYRVKDAGEELIVPPNWKEVSKSVRRNAGWNVVARLLKDPPTATRGAWPANSPRHTCASVLVALGTPLETLIFAFGHSGGHELLKRHYVARLTRKDAVTIRRIGPRRTKIPELEAA